jgi:N4-(beta-N-acetylglucosaminyl)-L-asparaginase
MVFSRRAFLTTAMAGAASLGLEGKDRKNDDRKKPDPNKADSAAVAGKRPIIVCAGNGYDYLDDAFAFLKNGGDTLDAALKVVKGPEDDPNENSVGLGGLPNEEGVVELDSCCMHGPTRRAGSVGGVRNIKNVSLVAQAVMEHTGHVMLVGEGAERFAVARGFPRENLLTEHSRKIWLLWKETHSDWWGPGLTSPEWHKRLPASPHADDFQRRIDRMKQVAADIGIEPEQRMVAIRKVLFPPTGTIHCSALNAPPLPAAWRGSCPDAAAIRPSSGPVVTPTRMWARREPRAAEKKISKSRERTPSWKICATGCLHSTPAWMR